MLKHEETRDMPFTPEQMYDLIADVRNYPQFLPWVMATRIKSDDEAEMIADMVVGFSVYREKFTSLVKKAKNQSIKIEYIDGPLKHLHNDWGFTANDDGGCTVSFFVEFSFKSRVLEMMAKNYFDMALGTMINAFQERAEKLYSAPSGSIS